MEWREGMGSSWIDMIIDGDIETSDGVLDFAWIRWNGGRGRRMRCLMHFGHLERDVQAPLDG